MLDPDYHMRVLSLVLNFVTENSWDFNKLAGTAREETIRALDGVEPADVIGQVFDIYFYSESGEFRADSDKVCRCFVEYLLQTGTTCDLEEFRAMWQQSLPVIDARNDLAIGSSKILFSLMVEARGLDASEILGHSIAPNRSNAPAAMAMQNRDRICVQQQSILHETAR